MAPNSEPNTLAHGRLLHQLKNRVRIVSPLLVKDPERCYILEVLLKKRPGVSDVRSVPSIGCVVVRFDPQTLPASNLLTLLDLMLGNLGRRAKRTVESTAVEVDSNQPEQEHHLAIEGMTCASCALLIEMVLTRDPRISAANVDFATESMVVKGRLDKQVAAAIVEKAGYRAYSFDSLAQRQMLIAN